MRSFFGSILLILVIAALLTTAFYNWSINSNLEFELRDPNEPEKMTEVIDITPPATEQKSAETEQNATEAPLPPTEAPAEQEAPAEAEAPLPVEPEPPMAEELPETSPAQ